MRGIDESELWISDDENENGAVEPEEEDPTGFVLGLQQAGREGAFHTRNKPNERQRKIITSFQSGPKKRPAFHVSCTAKAIVHGILDEKSGTRATLLIYDFSFFSYRSTRIKGAEILFEFQPKDRGAAGGPTVLKIAPNARFKMEQTTQTETRDFTMGLHAGGGSIVTAEGSLESRRSVEKTTTHAAEIIGSKWADEFGNHFQAHWSVKENDSQKNGIMALLRTCILLTRTDDEEFHCFPHIKAEPDFKSWLGSLVSSRGPDDPIIFSPEYEPYNLLEEEQGLKIDSRNLGTEALRLDKLWDCTFYRSFDEGVKPSVTEV